MKHFYTNSLMNRPNTERWTLGNENQQNRYGETHAFSIRNIAATVIMLLAVCLGGNVWGQAKPENSKGAKATNATAVQAKADKKGGKAKVATMEAVKRSAAKTTESRKQAKPAKQNSENLPEFKESWKNNTGIFSRYHANKWSEQGLYAGLTPQQEQIQYRTEHSKTFDNGDGTFSYMYIGDLHYKDANGSWQDIEVNIEKTNNGHYRYANTKNKFQTYYSDSPSEGIMMKYLGKNLVFAKDYRFEFLDTQGNTIKDNQRTGESAHQDDYRTLSYRNFYSDIDYNIIQLGRGVETGFAVKSRNAVADGAKTVRISQTVELPQGAYMVADGKKQGKTFSASEFEVMISGRDSWIAFQPVVVYDAHVDMDYIMKRAEIRHEGDKYDKEGKPFEDPMSKYSYKAMYNVTQTGNTLTVSFDLPAEWLLTSERAYPLFIDPTVTVLSGTTEVANNNAYEFYDHFYNDSRWDFRVTSDEMTAAGINNGATISAMGLLCRERPNRDMANSRIDLNNAAWSTTAWVTTGWQTCYGPTNIAYSSINTGTTSWNTYTFTSNFMYSTEHNNLLVRLTKDDNGCGGNNGGNYCVESSSTDVARGGYQDAGGTNNYPHDGISNSSMRKYRPAMQLTYTNSAGCSHTEKAVRNEDGAGEQVTRPYYRYSYTQILYQPSEICNSNTSPKIYGIAFRYWGDECYDEYGYDCYNEITRNLTIYLSETTNNELTAWETSDLTQVFTGNVTFTVGNWTWITFSTPYECSGSDNIVVTINDRTGSYITDASEYYFYADDADATDTYKVLTYYDDDTQVTNPANPGVSYDTHGKWRPYTKFCVDCIACPDVEVTITSEPSLSGCIPSGTEVVLTANIDVTSGLGSYNFTTGTDASRWYNVTNTTNLITSSGDGVASGLQDIGFTFPFAGNTYTQFSVNSDGNLRLGPTVTGTAYYTTPFSSYNANYNNPKINGMGFDGYFDITNQSNYVHKQVFGTAPNRVLVVEFYESPYSSSYRQYVWKWQVQLFEDGTVQLVYSSTAPGSYNYTNQVGLCVNASDGWTVNTSSHTATHFTNGTSTTNPAANSWPGANRYYRFTPSISYAWTYTGTPGTASGNTYTVSPTTNSTYTITVTVNGCEYSQSIDINPTNYTITATPNPANAGTATSNWNNGCNYTVTATPNDCHSFVNWTENGTVVSTDASYSFTAIGSRNLVANFEDRATSMTITTEPSSLECVPPGTEIVLTATPDIPGGMYAFTATSSSYSSISGSPDGTASSNGDGATFDVSLPFDFVLAGKLFASGTTLTMRCDGFVTFGSTWATNAPTTPGTTYSVISPLGYDQNLNDGESYMYYKVTGSAGSRVLTMEWKNMRSYFSTSNAYNWTNYQVRLYEGSNIVELCYGGFTHNYTSTSVYVYLSADGKITKLTSITSPVIASNTTGTTTSIPISSQAAAPSNGTVYRFTPPSFAWTYTGTAGTAMGNTYTVSPTTNSTYTATASVDGCTYSQSININPSNYTITATPNPAAGGTATSNWNNGCNYTVTATPNACYNFVNWTENGTEVSTNPSYSFTASSSRSLVANFVEKSVNISSVPTPMYCLASGTEVVMTASSDIQYAADNYAFTATSSSFSSISGSPDGTSSNTGDAATYAFSLPFDFNLAGKSFASGTTLTMRCDGFVSFGTAYGAHAPSTPGTTYSVISPLGYDQNLNSGESYMYYKVTGSAGNRVLTMEWKNMRSYYSTNSAYNWTNYQVKLYECSNIVELCYGAFTYNYTSTAVYIYLSADGKMTRLTSIAAPAIETNTTGSCASISIGSSSATPANGTVYRFTPPAPYTWTYTGTAGTVNCNTYTASPTQNSTYTVSVTGGGCTKTASVDATLQLDATIQISNP